ncbi:putative ATP/GTP binding protein-like 5 [Operophtera brumata]|uniref:Putative ATP/GTP binding protein-like 5 n=1 Tax=Operophtera brumata TaxID=104452 RepID=A0A0L7L160_OPEBR|nr:putative ATP/GTP binding protein-like 5 [Operophtera brumata]
MSQVGRSLGASILDLTGQHPNSRIPCSEHRNLSTLRDWLRSHTRTMRPQVSSSQLVHPALGAPQPVHPARLAALAHALHEAAANSRIPRSEHRNLSTLRDWLRSHTPTMRPQVSSSQLAHPALGAPQPVHPARLAALAHAHHEAAANSRIPRSEHRNLSTLRDWLRSHTRTMRPQLTMSRLRPKTSSPTRLPLYARSKAKVTDERKENTYVGAKTDTEPKRSPALIAPRSGHDIINMNMKFAKKNEPDKSTSRTRYLADNEPKPKTLSTKRRNILAIRKPNASKTQVGVVKTKTSRRSIEDTDSANVASKRSSFARSLRGVITRSNRCRAMASSSSEDLGGTWEDVKGGTALSSQTVADSVPGKRRPFPNPSPSHLKKIRLKTGL